MPCFNSFPRELGGFAECAGQRFARHLMPGIRLRPYCPKYPEISTIRCVWSLAKALIDPLVAGTIARFEVIAPSSAFSVDTSGRVCPCGHNVKYPSGVGGTTVTLKTCA